MQVPKQNKVAHPTRTGCCSVSGRGSDNAGASCLRKKLVNEPITICIASQTAIAALLASGTKSQLVADCIENLTALLGRKPDNHNVDIGHRDIEQNETADRLARKGRRSDLLICSLSHLYPSAGTIPK